MPRFGGLTPYPSKFGGAGPYGVRLKAILDSLNRQRGTAYDTSSTSNVYAENLATARLIGDVLSANQRLANQFDAMRITTSLFRWEKILGIVPAPTDTDTTRRNRIALIFARTGQVPFTSYLVTQLSSLMGSVFVALEFISPANAVIHVPDGTYPFGTVAAGSPWYSTIGHLLIRTKVPTGFSELDFQAAVGRMNPFLDSVMPSWATWDWYRPGTTSVSVVGGPSAGGFYLDDATNLNYEVFDV